MYEGNSQKQRENGQNQQPIVQKQDSGKLSIKELFIKNDLKTVGTYIFKDVMVPSILDFVVNSVTDAANLMFKGSTRPVSSCQPVNYNGILKRNTPVANEQSYKNVQSQQTTQYSDLSFARRDFAERLMLRVQEEVAQYGILSCSGLYDLANNEFANEPGYVNLRTSWTMEKYGWTDIRPMKVIQEGSQYILAMPKVVALKNI